MVKSSRNNRLKVVPAAHMFLLEGDQIFLMRRMNTGYSDGLLGVPSGHSDGGETCTMVAIRETLEEAGIKVLNPQFVHVMHTVDEYMHFFFVATHWEGTPRNAEPHKCSETLWVPFRHLPDDTIPYIRSAIAGYRIGLAYSEFGWE